MNCYENVYGKCVIPSCAGQFELTGLQANTNYYIYIKNGNTIYTYEGLSDAGGILIFNVKIYPNQTYTLWINTTGDPSDVEPIPVGINQFDYIQFDTYEVYEYNNGTPGLKQYTKIILNK